MVATLAALTMSFVALRVWLVGHPAGLLTLPPEYVRNDQYGFLFGMLLCSAGLGYLAYRNTTNAEDELELEFQRSEKLLRNSLPDSIARRLKSNPSVIADSYADASVLFADIVGFTGLCAKKSPEELVSLLNTVFSEFDDLADKHGLEKIKTIGDAYMVTAGVPERTRITPSARRKWPSICCVRWIV